jgi:hypothetical protein
MNADADGKPAQNAQRPEREPRSGPARPPGCR